MMMRSLLTVLIATTLVGCAFGNKYRYQDIMADLPRPGVPRVAVATLDQREYIVSGEDDPSYAGMTRGGYANPFDAHTESGQAMSEEITHIVTRALEKDGVTAVAVSTTPRDREAEVRQKLLSNRAPRAVLLILHEWQSDTYNNTSLSYDVEIQVFGEDGRTLASDRFRGEDDLGGSVWNPIAHAQEAVPAGAKHRIEGFFTQASISSALATSK
jgi:hypothetical protein